EDRMPEGRLPVVNVFYPGSSYTESDGTVTWIFRASVDGSVGVVSGTFDHGTSEDSAAGTLGGVLSANPSALQSAEGAVATGSAEGVAGVASGGAGGSTGSAASAAAGEGTSGTVHVHVVPLRQMKNYKHGDGHSVGPD